MSFRDDCLDVWPDDEPELRVSRCVVSRKVRRTVESHLNEALPIVHGDRIVVSAPAPEEAGKRLEKL
jgi:hypothetical protein